MQQNEQIFFKTVIALIFLRIYAIINSVNYRARGYIWLVTK